MKSMIMMGCLWMLSYASNAQGDSRIASGTPLRWGMNGSIEVMPEALAKHYGSNDTAAAYRRTPTTATVVLGGNPHATRFASVQAQCANNSIRLNWVAVQHSGADNYEIQQSTNGRNWQVVGVVPANRTDIGEASYLFTYNKDVSNVMFRIAATNMAGDKVFSSSFESPCSNTAYLGVTPNPVYSTTTVRVGSPGATKVQMVLLDAKGMAVFRSDNNLVQGTNHLPLNISHLPAGYYTLVIRWSNGKQDTLPVVKQ
jgi:hypothetical protein